MTISYSIPWSANPRSSLVRKVVSGKYKISGGKQKYILREIAKRWLPSEILNHKKQGFEAPMSTWLRGDLQDYMRDKLSASRLGKFGVFDHRYVKHILDSHVSGKGKYNKLIFSLIIKIYFTLFLKKKRKYLKGKPDEKPLRLCAHYQRNK